MLDALAQLPSADLAALAQAARAGQLSPPYSAASIARLLHDSLAHPVSEELAGLGLAPAQLSQVLDLLAQATAMRPAVAECVQVVATAPETGQPLRDTAVVLADMLRSATGSVLIAGYAVYNARRVFKVLAQRMEELPALEVRLYLDIQRGPGDNSVAAGVVHRFLQRLRQSEWPAGKPLPVIYYDPRALAGPGAERAVLHAKCAVVDRAIAFVSSANLTAAAQERNIELGLRVESPAIAAKIHGFFDHLVASGRLVRAE